VPKLKSPELDLSKVEDVLKNYETSPGWLIPVLQDIQQEYNYLPREALAIVSERLDVPMSQVYGVASFYASFSLKPRGKNIIRICMGTACHLKGSQKLVDTIGRELGIKDGQTTEDMKFTLELVNCLGCCALAPVVTIAGQYHERMSPAKLVGALKKASKRKTK
jgi:NADH-quinone oxidoreductase subunit E